MPDPARVPAAPLSYATSAPARLPWLRPPACCRPALWWPFVAIMAVVIATPPLALLCAIAWAIWHTLFPGPL